MATKFVTGITEEKDSFKAGETVGLQALKKLDSLKPSIALLFVGSDYNYDQVIQGFKSVIGDTPLLGCSAAGEFTEEKISSNGVACALISSDNTQFLLGYGKNITYDEVSAAKEATKNFPKIDEECPCNAAILLMDGLAGKGEECVLAASQALGPKMSFAGGTAADNMHFKETRIFCGDQILTNALAACLICADSPIIISCKHGHKPMSPALKVTKAKDNVIYEIEGRPALEVWKEHVAPLAKLEGIDVYRMDQKQLAHLLVKHEAGLMTGDSYKVRFPVSANGDGSLNFVCTILEGSMIKFMTSEMDDQISSAKAAAKMALDAAKGKKIAGAIIFDCVCRTLYLGDRYHEAVEAKKELFGDIPFIGIDTYGEIAMQSGQMSGFHNTATVIMLLPE